MKLLGWSRVPQKLSGCRGGKFGRNHPWFSPFPQPQASTASSFLSPTHCCLWSREKRVLVAIWSAVHICFVNSAMDTQQGNVPKKKASRSHRVWRKSEEDALMKCMVEEISDKWSADNGFKPGFFTLLEKEMAKIMPESNIKASPHINSKVKYWRQTYAKICDILKLSGFGWDHVNKRIDVDDDVWKVYEEAYPRKAKEVGGKHFPYFDDWEIIFGKDRANGLGAEAPAQMGRLHQNVDMEEENDGLYHPFFGEEFHPTHTSGPSGVDNEIPLNSSPPDSTPPVSTPPVSTPPISTPPVSTSLNSARRTSLPTSTPRTSTPPANAGTQKGKKRTRMGDVESLAASMEVWLEKSDGHMEKMTNAMGYSKDVSARRTQVPKELEKLDFTDTQRFKLGAVICAEEDRLDLFYGTREDLKQAWAEAVLDGIIFGPV